MSKQDKLLSRLAELTLRDANYWCSYSIAKHFKFKWDKDQIDKDAEKFFADRNNGGSIDPNANVNSEEYHKFLDQLSKPELIDLVLEIHFNHIINANASLNRNEDPTIELVKETVDILIARYCCRHPKELEQEA